MSGCRSPTFGFSQAPQSDGSRQRPRQTARRSLASSHPQKSLYRPAAAASQKAEIQRARSKVLRKGTRPVGLSFSVTQKTKIKVEALGHPSKDSLLAFLLHPVQLISNCFRCAEVVCRCRHLLILSLDMTDIWDSQLCASNVNYSPAEVATNPTALGGISRRDGHLLNPSSRAPGARTEPLASSWASHLGTRTPVTALRLAGFEEQVIGKPCSTSPSRIRESS
jgi:hypothetical protein